MRLSPLGFIVVILALWTGIRAVALLPERSPLRARRIAATPPPATALATRSPAQPLPPRTAAATRATGRAAKGAVPAAPARLSAMTAPAAMPGTAPPPAPTASQGSARPPLAPALARPRRRSLSGEAYLFLRSGAGAGLAPGAQLGGGQLFARLSAPLSADGALAVTVRASRALEGPGGEAAFGLRWAPFPNVPVSLSAERRVALDGGGRDAWSIMAAGGVYDAPIGPLRVDGYMQAGLVGWRRRDGFVDGAVRLGLPLGQARLGPGLWGAAQPGAARLDIGPQATIRLAGGVTAALDGRIRIAGKAEPGSGVALTLATGF